MSEARFRAIAQEGPPETPPRNRDWLSLMETAFALAEANAEFEEVPVGALVVSPDGEILGTGANRVIRDRDPTAHAEILAIREACRRKNNFRLNGCVMIVTLEPCLLCAAAISQARLAGVVFGCADAREGAIVSRSDFIALTGHKKHIWHLGGVLASRCAYLLTKFFNEKRRRDSGRSHERTGIS